MSELIYTEVNGVYLINISYPDSDSESEYLTLLSSNGYILQTIEAYDEPQFVPVLSRYQLTAYYTVPNVFRTELNISYRPLVSN